MVRAVLSSTFLAGMLGADQPVSPLPPGAVPAYLGASEKPREHLVSMRRWDSNPESDSSARVNRSGFIGGSGA